LFVEPDPGDLRWNHSDSIASKMGNRSSRLIGPVDSVRSHEPPDAPPAFVTMSALLGIGGSTADG
jgi:hypothetical protein